MGVFETEVTVQLQQGPGSHGSEVSESLGRRGQGSERPGYKTRHLSGCGNHQELLAGEDGERGCTPKAKIFLERRARPATGRSRGGTA